MRQITQEEWDRYNWVEVTVFEDEALGRRVFVPSSEKTEPPPMPDGEHVYFQEKTTRLGDSKDSYRWVPAFTYAPVRD